MTASKTTTRLVFELNSALRSLTSCRHGFRQFYAYHFALKFEARFVRFAVERLGVQPQGPPAPRDQDAVPPGGPPPRGLQGAPPPRFSLQPRRDRARPTRFARLSVSRRISARAISDWV